MINRKFFVKFLSLCGVTLFLISCSNGNNDKSDAVGSNANDAPTGASVSSPSPDTKDFSSIGLCKEVFPGQEVISWSTTTVAELRSWSHGGPEPISPFAKSFPGYDGTDPAAWCLVRDDESQSSWYAVVDESNKEVAIVIDTSDGENFEKGEVDGPPVAP